MSGAKKVIKAPIRLATHPQDLFKPKKLVKDLTGKGGGHKSSPAPAAVAATTVPSGPTVDPRLEAIRNIPILNAVRPPPPGAAGASNNNNTLLSNRTLLGS